MTRHPESFLMPMPRFGHGSRLDNSRVVVAIEGNPHGRSIADAFRRVGWDVEVVRTNAEARKVARSAHTCILTTTATNDESGFLTCKKLLLEKLDVKVVLVSPRPTETERRLAYFVGATALIRDTALCLPMQVPTSKPATYAVIH